MNGKKNKNKLKTWKKNMPRVETMGLCDCCIKYRTLHGKDKNYCFDCWNNPNCETE